MHSTSLHVGYPRSPFKFPALSYFFFSGSGFVPMCCCHCHASHIMSSCALHLHTCSSHASEHFPRCPFCIPVLLCPPVSLSISFSCACIKYFWIGLILAKWPWFTTGRPPIKFRTIWTLFGTPTVNRGTEKASCVLQPNTLPNWPKTHLNLSHHRAFNHDRVAANRTSFGAS